jgi:hypothetical protein
MPSALSRLAMVCVLVIAAASAAQATSINYGDYSGTSVVFQQVTESSTTNVLPLYGSPTVSGNALLFLPTNFLATSGHDGTVTTEGTLATTIAADLGYNIQLLTITEQGGYNLFGPGTSVTSASVTGTATLTILDVDGTPLGSSIVVPNLLLAFTPSGGSYNFGVDPSGGAWSGIATINVASILSQNNLTGNVTRVSLSLDNLLTATSQEGSVVSISKNGVGDEGTTGIYVGGIIPEPLTCVSFAALGGLLTLLRRSRLAA